MSVRPSANLSVPFLAAAAAGGLDAERTAGRKYRSIVAGAQLAPVLSGKRGQRHVEPTEEVEHSCVFWLVLNVLALESRLPDVDPLLVGRSRELSDLADLLGSPGGMVTLVSGVGCGKTAVAVAVALALRARKSITSLYVDCSGCQAAVALLRRLISVLGQ